MDGCARGVFLGALRALFPAIWVPNPSGVHSWPLVLLSGNLVRLVRGFRHRAAVDALGHRSAVHIRIPLGLCRPHRLGWSNPCFRAMAIKD